MIFFIVLHLFWINFNFDYNVCYFFQEDKDKDKDEDEDKEKEKDKEEELDKMSATIIVGQSEEYDTLLRDLNAREKVNIQLSFFFFF